MVSVHVYGKLRRFAAQSDPCGESVIPVQHTRGDTVRSIVERLGIPLGELGSNVFVDGRYASLASSVQDGSRLGLFPDDMQLLYKWYFRPAEPSPKEVASEG
jgi:hypothetical protein